MDQTQRGPTFEESIKQVMQTLPLPIRHYLGQGKYSVVAGNLMAKYSLHVDQGGILEREIMLLLMGIENPDEFTQALAGEAKLDQQTVNSIVQDVNAQIFVPLREEMRKGPVPASMPQPVRPPAPVNARVPSYGPPPQPQRHFQLQNKIPPPRHAVAPGAGGPPRSDLRSVLTSVTGEKLLEDHEEPHIEFSKASVPPNLPGVLPPRPTPPAPTRPPYSTDPYREPLEP